jgi:hypothetical protein
MKDTCKCTEIVMNFKSASGGKYRVSQKCIHTIQWDTLQWMNESCNEVFIKKKSGCHNECRGILLADIECTCAWCFRPSHFD